MARYFRVITNKDSDTGQMISYGVSDITDKEWDLETKLKSQRESVGERLKYANDEEVRPRLATFKVTQLYGQEEQEKMAHALCDYMNKVADAQEQALKQNSLVEVLTAKSAEYNP